MLVSGGKGGNFAPKMLSHSLLRRPQCVLSHSQKSLKVFDVLVCGGCQALLVVARQRPRALRNVWSTKHIIGHDQLWSGGGNGVFCGCWNANAIVTYVISRKECFDFACFCLQPLIPCHQCFLHALPSSLPPPLPPSLSCPVGVWSSIILNSLITSLS